MLFLPDLQSQSGFEFWFPGFSYRRSGSSHVRLVGFRSIVYTVTKSSCSVLTDLVSAGQNSCSGVDFPSRVTRLDLAASVKISS
jgi:hypothetical protein